MSKIALQPNNSGNGTFTIASPDSNTNRTLTLPDASGTLFAGAIATQAEAEAGTNNTTVMTPLRVAQSIIATTAALAVGGVGTYAFAVLVSGTVPATGGTTAGSNLAYTNVNSTTGSGTPSGTWRLMGWVDGTGLNGRSLWLRIS
jgi:hypothetical protein